MKHEDCKPVYLSPDQYIFLMGFQHDAVRRRVMKALAYGVMYGYYDYHYRGGLIVIPQWALPDIKAEDL